MDLPEGRTRLHYYRERGLLLPLFAIPEERSLLSTHGNAFAMAPYVLWCEVRFTISAQGRVAGRELAGNACPR